MQSEDMEELRTNCIIDPKLIYGKKLLILRATLDCAKKHVALNSETMFAVRQSTEETIFLDITRTITSQITKNLFSTPIHKVSLWL